MRRTLLCLALTACQVSHPDLTSRGGTHDASVADAQVQDTQPEIGEVDSGDLGPPSRECVPDVETCNGMDDDCDLSIDEEIGARSCELSAVECAGAQTCEAGRWSECAPTDTRADSDCDGLDNDCDGRVDEAFDTACRTACDSAGTASCTEGSLSMCVGESIADSDRCDGRDNDCDGRIDEDLPETCNTGREGICAIGLPQCTAGTATCNPVSTPSVEICDGDDDDCDGRIDNNCCRPLSGRFEYCETPRNYADALADCERRGGTLADFANVVEAGAVAAELIAIGARDAWFGLNRRAGSWSYTSGAPDNVDFWEPGEPNGTGPCVRVKRDATFRFADWRCADPFAYLCQR